MPEVTITGFDKIDHALEALAVAEYREFLSGAGCPADQIEKEVEAFSRIWARKASKSPRNPRQT